MVLFQRMKERMSWLNFCIFPISLVSFDTETKMHQKTKPPENVRSAHWLNALIVNTGSKKALYFVLCHGQTSFIHSLVSCQRLCKV